MRFAKWALNHDKFWVGGTFIATVYISINVWFLLAAYVGGVYGIIITVATLVAAGAYALWNLWTKENS